MSELRASVLVVGAGPTGLALAVELGMRGVRCLVIERNDRVGYAPRAKTTHTRTREHLRRWGIADKLADASPFGVDYPSNILFVTRLAGHRLAKFENAFNCAPARNELYSEHAQWVPQYKLEEVLRAHVETLPSVELRFNTRFLSAEQGSAGVVSRAEDVETGETFDIRSDFLVGADGPRSLVRELIGATMEGAYGMSRNFNIIFRAPGLAEAHSHGPGIMYWQTNPDIPSVLGPMDQGDLWFFMPSAVPPELELTDESAGALIRAATGIDLPYEILSSDEWVASRFIADKYSDGRIFIAGDACHLHPPLGGYGMNMGVSDSVDLGWKLAAVLPGWADPSLLGSYEGERRTVHRRVIDEAMANLTAARGAVLRPGIEAEGPEGDALRAEVSALIEAIRIQEFRSLGVVLGYSYAGSPFVAEEAGPAPQSTGMDYQPTAYPGSRAPHAWLDDGRSLFDAFGAGFTLLVMDERGETDACAAERDARALGVPLAVVRLPLPRLAALYEAPLALIRPDQHVAWRGKVWPGQGILKRATGRLAETAPADRVGESREQG